MPTARLLDFPLSLLIARHCVSQSLGSRLIAARLTQQESGDHWSNRSSQELGTEVKERRSAETRSSSLDPHWKAAATFCFCCLTLQFVVSVHVFA